MGDMKAYNELNLADLEGVSGGVLLKDMTSKERNTALSIINMRMQGEQKTRKLHTKNIWNSQMRW